MTEDDDSGEAKTFRDAFRVWDVSRVEREVVLRSSDDQYVAVALPSDDAERFENLAESGGTLEATLVARDGDGTSWKIETIHGVEWDE